MDAEARLADQQIQLGLIRNSEARLRAAFDNAASESHAVATATGSGYIQLSAAFSATRSMNSLPSRAVPAHVARFSTS
jgi:hypothetical protein